MATICCLCGRQQHGMLPSYPLSAEHRELDLCEACYRLLSELENHAQQAPEVYQQDRKLLCEYQTANGQNLIVSDFIAAQLSHCDAIAAPFLSDKKLSKQKRPFVVEGAAPTHPALGKSLTSAGVKYISWVLLALGIVAGIICGATVTPMFFFSENAFQIAPMLAVWGLGLLLFLGCRLFAAHLLNQERMIDLLNRLQQSFAGDGGEAE